MNQNEIRKAVYDKLAADTTLVSMLADNVNWSQTEKTGTKSKLNSITPLDKFDYTKMELPVLTIQMGEPMRADYHLVEQNIYIRCYNSSQKSFVEIGTILTKVISLLHRKELTLSDNRLIEMVWQGSSAESFDEAYNLPYIEARFVIATV